MARHRRWASIGLVALAVGAARAQVPDVLGTSPPAPAPRVPAPAAAGPIDVDRAVPDATIQRTLEWLLPQYPGVDDVAVTVDRGVVALEGRVQGDDTRGELTRFVQRVEGVRLVLNRTRTEAETMTATQRLARLVDDVVTTVEREWLVALMALALVVGSWTLAHLFSARSERLLAPFVRNPVLRSIAGSLVSSILGLGGLLAALSIMNLTRAVLSILGLASIVGLAVGFAFKDITENFIASVLLGVRRPFMVGDSVTIAGQSGVVRTLTTRATVLVTPEGNHVWIPNSVVFKEVLVNSTAGASVRGSFDVLVSSDAPTVAALEAVTRALQGTEGLLADPPPRALVEAIEPMGVRLRAYFWLPSRNVDGPRLQSEARLRAKRALQEAGIALAPVSRASPDVPRMPAAHDDPEHQPHV